MRCSTFILFFAAEWIGEENISVVSLKSRAYNIKENNKESTFTLCDSKY